MKNKTIVKNGKVNPISKQAKNKEKTLLERNCKMHYQWNRVFNAWNGYLYKDEKNLPTLNGVPNNIKCFIYDTKKECEDAATAWANQNPRKLKNYKE